MCVPEPKQLQHPCRTAYLLCVCACVCAQVTLELEFESGEAKEYTVTTMQAALLGHFGDDDERTLAQVPYLLTDRHANIPSSCPSY